eukprot:gene7615-770_t
MAPAAQTLNPGAPPAHFAGVTWRASAQGVTPPPPGDTWLAASRKAIPSDPRVFGIWDLEYHNRNMGLSGTTFLAAGVATFMTAVVITYSASLYSMGAVPNSHYFQTINSAKHLVENKAFIADPTALMLHHLYPGFVLGRDEGEACGTPTAE